MFSSLAVALVVACLVVIASLLLFVGFAWVVGCVVGGSFSLWTKRKKSAFICALSLLGLGAFIINYLTQ